MKQTIIDFLNNLPSPVTGTLMSIFISILRVVYDKEETKPMRIIMESLVCGGLTLTAGAGINALGLNPNWVMFMGGVIGYLGSAKVRDFAMRFINNKIEEK
jgi:lambda family phage holin